MENPVPGLSSSIPTPISIPPPPSISSSGGVSWQKSRLLRFQALLQNLEYEYSDLLQSTPAELEYNESIPLEVPAPSEEPADREENEAIPLETSPMLTAACPVGDDKPLLPEEDENSSFLFGSLDSARRITMMDGIDNCGAEMDRRSAKTGHNDALHSMSKTEDSIMYSSKASVVARPTVSFEGESACVRSFGASYKLTETMSLTDGRFTDDGKFVRSRSRRLNMFPVWWNPDKQVLVDVMMATANTEKHVDILANQREVRCILSPLAFPRLHWDFFAVVLIFYDAWATPFQMVFQSDDLESAWMRHCDHAITCFFALDIVANFNTAFIVKRGLCFRRGKIARRYLKTWFLIDLMATFPFDLIYQVSSVAGFIRFLKMARFLKMIRLVRLRKTIKSLEMSESVYFQVMPDITRVIAMLGLLLLLLLNVHLFSCMWLALGDTMQVDSLSKVMHVYFDTFAAIFFSLSNGTRLHPQTTIMKMFEMVISAEQFIIISLFGAYAVFEALMLYGDTAKSRVMRDQVRRYMMRHGLALKTQIEVLSGLDEARSVRALQKDFVTLVTSDLPEELQQKIAFELWYKNLMKLDLFVRISEWDGEFCWSLSLLCREEVFATDVVIFREHDVSSAAYCILTGELKVTCVLMDVDIPSFGEGTWVGECALVKPLGRRGLKVVSLTLSCVMVVSSESFQKLLKESNLWHRFEEFMTLELFNGLCGRCGSIGDHFFDNCPHECSLFGRAVSKKSRCPCWPSAHGAANVDQANFREVSDFLHHFDAMHLLPYLQKMEIYSLKQLQSLDIDSLSALSERAEPPHELSRRDKKVLSTKIINMYRNAIKHDLIEEHDLIEDDLHVLFLSHYKVEAGTEAALMRSELEQILEQFMIEEYMFKAPIFLDSEDLTILSQLEEHVKKSFNVVLLLTRGVLSRPWVLVELVTAVRCGIPVVPVQVVKPGFEFAFPTESFYADLRAGNFLDEAGRQLLHDCNISEALIEQTLRKVFQSIAGIYSPHRPAQVRHAELLDLLGSCKIKDSSCYDLLKFEEPNVMPTSSVNKQPSVTSLRSLKKMPSAISSRSPFTKGASMPLPAPSRDHSGSVHRRSVVSFNLGTALSS